MSAGADQRQIVDFIYLNDLHAVPVLKNKSSFIPKGLFTHFKTKEAKVGLQKKTWIFHDSVQISLDTLPPYPNCDSLKL